MEPTDPARPTRRFIGRLADDDTSLRPKYAGESAPSRRYDAGEAIGRYVVLRRVGSGGMGVVYAAYDPELDRKVALKLLRVEESSRPDGSRSEQARLVRESRALAKLSHPNVVGIYDVGTVDGSVFMTMELVEGTTLRAWLGGKAKPWREAVAKLVEAGRGLAAAHAAGLVHRDFKPSNVLISEDGRVYVTDFGLARPTVQAEVDGASLDQSSLDPQERLISGEHFAATGDVTEFGVVVGTPAFMAPEQASGGHVDARTDQFSLCITLYWCLYGEGPFPVHPTLRRLDYRVVRDAPRDAHVPVWLRRVVLRGLSRRPDDRYPSMEALFEALLDDPARRWRRRGAAIGAVAVLGLGAWGYARALEPAQPCEVVDARADEVWSADKREAARQAYADVDRSYATTAWARADAAMIEFVDGWRAGWLDACEATHVRHEYSAEILDRRMWCLSSALDEGVAIADVLAAADAQVAGRTFETLARLPDLRACADTRHLLDEAGPPPDEATRLAVERARAKVAEAEALEVVGRVPQAMEVARTAVVEGEILDYAPLLARARFTVGRLHALAEDDATAHDVLQDALCDAERAGHDGLKVDIMHYLTHVDLVLDDHVSTARVWVDLAEAVLARTDGGEPSRRITQLERQSELLHHDADYEGALKLQQRALKLREAATPPDARIAGNYNNVGLLLSALGDEAAALEHHERALQLVEEHFGADHPNVGHLHVNLGGSYTQLGMHGQAQPHLARAIEVFSASLGASHPVTANARQSMAFSHFRVARFDEAEAEISRAERDLEAALGPDAPLLDTIAYTHGWIALGRGEFEAALAYFERARDAARATWGLTAQIAHTYDGVGEALVALGRPQEAIVVYEECLALAGDDPPRAFLQGYHLMGLGTAHLRAGQPQQAVGYLQEALELLDASSQDPTIRGRTRGALAQALAEREGEQARVQTLAAQAREDLAAIDGRTREDLAPTVRWLDTSAPTAAP